MTREHKLALIVGFSLILLVGVLISDHLSSARQAQVGAYGPGDTQIAEVAPLAPMDPLRGLEPPVPPGWSDPRLYQADASERVPPLPSSIGTVFGRPEPTLVAADEHPAPVLIGQGPEMSRRNGEENNGLVRAIVEAGGTIVERNGIQEIVMPPAAQIRPDSRTASSETALRATPVAADEPYEWYTVQRGDTLFQIAARAYGDGNLWREIAKRNADRVDEKGGIRAGVRIRLPASEGVTGRPSPDAKRMAAASGAPAQSTRSNSAAAATTPPAPPAPPAPSSSQAAARQSAPEFATYTVRPGDTLGTISQRTLGTARRWREIAEINRIENENMVRAGRVLKIPASSNQG